MDESRLSLAQRVALMPEEARNEFYASLSEQELAGLEHDWEFWARPQQLVRDEPYYPIRLFLTGRGWGKTKTASEWIRQQVKNHPGCRIAILGRTTKDVRDVMVLGESGVLNVGPPEERPVHRPSESRLIWPQYDNAQAFLYSSEVPDAPRGSQYHYYLADELASHSPFVGADGLTAFQNIQIATRLGEKPYGLITTTPKRTKVLRDLLTRAKEKGDVLVVRGKTDENTALSTTYMEQIHGLFDGTKLAAQELSGEMLDEDPEGALWKQAEVDEHRDHSPEMPTGAQLRVVAVDPSVAENPNDECGIVVIGATKQRDLLKRHAYVLEDASIKASPEVWAQKVVDTAKKWKAGAVVVELNQGQHLVKMAIQAIDPTIRVVGVNASRGKKLRAEPVTLPYQQGRVHHWGYHPELEDQMTSWEPEMTKRGDSPDRIDAMVHGVTALLIDPPKGLFTGPLRAKASRGRKLPDGRGAGRTFRDGTGK